MTSKNTEAESYYNHGLLKSALGSKQDAIADFDRVISLNYNYTLA